MRNKDRYNELWYDVIRPAILKRDCYKCTRCHVKHRAIGYRANSGKFIECDKFMIEWCKTKGIKVFKIFLQVAHLDHDPSNNDYSNLRSFCARCHLSNDKILRHLKRISK